MRVSRPLLAIVALTICLLAGASCGGDDGEAAEEDVTVAFLRAVFTGDRASQDAFVEELEGLGYVQGDNLTLLAEDPSEIHPEADDVEDTVEGWVRDDGADLIVALSSSGALIAGEAAGEVPVLFLSTDPTATGLVEDERRPEANLTGATFRVPADRTLAIASEALGRIERIACLYPDDDPAGEPSRRDIERGAASLDIEVTCVPFSAGGAAAAAADVVELDVDAVLLANAPSTVRAFPELETALAPSRVPVVANTEVSFAVLVLQPDVASLYRQMAHQAARLLGGAPVAETPVEDPGEFELIVNTAVADRLGISIPDAVLERADHVIR